MQFFEYILTGVLKEYQEIIIYGAGWFAEQIYPIFCKNGLQDRIICFAVSKMKGKEWFKEIEIKEIDDIECDKEKAAVLIAVTNQYVNEVITSTTTAGFKNVLVAVDYIRSDINMAKFYQGLEYEQFIEYIAKKHMYDFPKEKEISLGVKEKAIERQSRNEYSENQIVYITGQLLPRNIKMIAALKKKGFDIITIIYGRLVEGFISELCQQGISYILCNDEEEMVFQAVKYRPLVYYFQPIWGNCIWLEIMLQYKKYFRPIVIGLYDVLNDGYVIENPVWLTSEKYVLENADGIVWRWSSKEYLEQEKGFTYKGKSIDFHDYCGGYIKEYEKEQQNGSTLKLCNVQGLFGYFPQKGDMLDGYKLFSSLEEITDVLGNKENCILDIYIGQYNVKDYEKAKKIEEQYSNIRFFWEVEHMKLIERLQDYDYGCEFYNEGNEIPMNMSVICGPGKYRGSMIINSEAHRFYDFIDAGIPVITIMPRKQVEFLDKYGVIVKMSLQSLDIDFLQENKEELKRKALLARQKLDIDEHIDGLIKFFRDL